MNVRVMKACAWSGVACLVLLGIGFWPLAHFIPPPSPDWTAQRTARFYIQHRTGIRFGMTVAMFSAALFAPFSVSITIQMRRMEGKVAPLALIQLVLGAIFVLEIIILLFFWETATFRTDRSPQIIQALSDLGWIPFVGLIGTMFLEIIVYGLAILLDRRPTPVMPRWAGYFNLWVAVAYVAGAFNVFFKTGPLAWDGLISWYVPIAVFAIFLPVNSWLLARAVDDYARELAVEAAAETKLAAVRADAATANGYLPPQAAAEMDRMRQQLDELLAARR